MSVQYEIIVHGRVQGVGFRASARNQARSLNLKGWVENQRDGTVLLVVNGEEASCSQFIHWCSLGSGYSWVESLEIKSLSPGPLSSFSIRY